MYYYRSIESRKKKSRNWEEEDYYDSDEDNFLDRTGTVERKREQRMKLAGKCEEKVETYSSLVMSFYMFVCLYFLVEYIIICAIIYKLKISSLYYFRLENMAKL